jgi:DNA-binding transcriptional MerR regulator/methylmalonyl-CoA mutase cobalamin-binding subunit
VTERANRYPIGAVSRLTGLPVDTLRIWERRYGVVAPGRDERGRLYSDADVRRLQLLGAAVDRGHSIGRVAKLSDVEIEALLTDAPAAMLHAERGEAPAVPPDGILKALDDYDATALDRELGRLALALPPRALIHRVVLPTMKEVGDRWASGRLTVAQEHLLSASLRTLLGALSRLAGADRGGPRLLFATPSGDRHEFGILAAALLAALGGLHVTYLGPDLPSGQIADAATRGGTHVVVLGLTFGATQPSSIAEVQALMETLPPSVELWLGGPLPAGFEDAPSRPGLYVLRDFGALEVQLARVGSRL